MKTYPYPNGRTHPRKLRPQNKKLILFILFILLAILSFAQSGSGGVSRSGGGVSGLVQEVNQQFNRL